MMQMEEQTYSIWIKVLCSRNLGIVEQWEVFLLGDRSAFDGHAWPLAVAVVRRDSGHSQEERLARLARVFQKS